jgi:trans-aconitate methyltransferase
MLQCPGCGGNAADVFFDQPKLPVHCNILWETAETARRAPTGSMRLAVCPDCGHLFNAAFDPQLVTYDATYENSLHYSPTFEAYAAALAEDLSDRLQLRDRLVVEVGCGKGDFLRRLCRTSGARGLGIDASYDPAIVADAADDRVQFVREPFSEMPAGVEAALVFCRHVLEHVPDPHGFVSELAAGAKRSTACRVLVEVPNALYTLRDLGIWDLIYEHCSYFSAPSLTRLCERAGLRVDRAEAVYGNQFLCVEGTVGDPAATAVRDEDVREVRQLAAQFRDEYARKVDHWARRLQELAAAGKSVALWGAGSKGITFVNTVPGGSSLACLVDLNPRKQGRFVPGTGQPVVSPEALAAIKPDLIVVMNPLYREEVAGRAAEIGLSCPIDEA